MNVGGARVVLRPRSVLDTLDLALRFITTYPGPYLRLSIVVLLPCVGLSWLFAQWLGWAWGWGLTAAAGTIASVPFTMLAGRLVFEPAVRVRDVVRAFVKMLPHVLGVRVLQTVVVAGGTIFLLLPGALLQSMMLFVIEVATLEHARPLPAFARSFRIANTRQSHVLMALFVLGLAHLTAVFVSDVVGRSLITDLLEFQAPASLWSSRGGLLSLLGFWFFIPLGATARFFVYLDMRTRSEGWDIQTRFAALAARAPRDMERTERAA